MVRVAPVEGLLGSIEEQKRREAANLQEVRARFNTDVSQAANKNTAAEIKRHDEELLRQKKDPRQNYRAFWNASSILDATEAKQMGLD